MSSLLQRNLVQPLQSQSNFLEYLEMMLVKKTDKQMKQNLKMAILAANNDKPIPPVYYLLKSKSMESECAFDETHEQHMYQKS